MDYYFDADEASRVVEFSTRYLTHQKGEFAGSPFVPDDWQVDRILAPLFGTFREDGTRKYRQAICYLPRKNGKSTLAVLVALYCLFCDSEPGAEVYCAAADTSQAEIVFNIARAMVEDSPTLRKRCKIYRRSIVVPETNSVFRVLSSDANTKHGFNASAIIYDELHAWKSRELYDVLHTSTGARRQPLEFIISTAGIYEPEGIAWQLYDYAKKVEEGTIEDPAVLPCIYEAASEADYRDPEVWAKANPGLGASIKREYLEAEAKRAAAEPSYENTFRRLHLGQWTQQVTRWLKIEDWQACAQEIPDLTGRECFGGLDLSTTTDFSAFVLAFPGDPTYLLPFFWIPEGRLQQSRDRVPYDLWERQGLLTATPGAVVDYEQIRADINELARTYNLQEIRFDPWNATQLATQLGEQDGFKLTQMRQGFVSMNAPTKEFERRIIGRTLAHNDNAVLNWMIGNVAVKQDPAGNLKPDKSKSTERIDGVVAGIMALSGAMAAREQPDYDILWL